jgi:signal transduction histidine kinase
MVKRTSTAKKGGRSRLKFVAHRKGSMQTSLIQVLEGPAGRKELSQRILSLISEVTRAAAGILFMLVEDQGLYETAAVVGQIDREVGERKVLKNDPLLNSLSKGRTVVPDGGRGTDLLLCDWMTGMGMDVCLPLFSNSRLVGFCVLRKRHGAKGFAAEELRRLKALEPYVSVALENNLLAEAVRKTRLLIQRANRLHSLETISGGFAHEIRNPLTSIKTFISLVPQMKGDEEFINRFSRVALEDVDRIERLLDDILMFAKANQPRLEEEDLNELVSSSVYFIRMEAEKRGVKVLLDLDDTLPAMILDRQQIKQVLLNLFLNAIDAMKEGGTLNVRTSQASRDAVDWIRIEVADNGSGIPSENLPYIFDPFFTTKKEEDNRMREGTGLGLAIVRQIVEDHHGRIEVESRLGQGTAFKILLPRSPQLQSAPQKDRTVSK